MEQYDAATLDGIAGVEFHAGVLCAGFVNAHSHLELAYLKGAIAERGGYASFAASMAAVRNNFSEEERLTAIAEADRAMWEEGVDAVADIVNGPTSFATKAASPILYHSFAEVFGLRSCNLAEQRALLANPCTTLTPHSTYSLSEAAFRAACEGDGSQPLSIHFLESEAEAELYRGHGSLHEWYEQMGFECDFLHHSTPAERLVRSVPHDRSVLLVHNCYLTEEDIDTIMNHFTAPVYWVLCPRSNSYISGLEPRTVALMRARGLNICIGTDSLASNWSLSMLDELKRFKGVPLDELLGWATLGGAKALGLDHTLGVVEVGRRCGIVNISGVDFASMSLTDNAVARRLL